MNRTTSFGENEMSMLDKMIFMLRKMQFRSALQGNLALAVDLGSGHRAPLLQTLLRDGIIDRGHAIDLSLDESIFSERLTGEEHDLNHGVVSLPEGSADLVVSLAILEHLTDPEHHVREAYRLLGRGRKIVLTTPSPYGKPVLELMAYRLKVIDEAEIRDHKYYYSKREIEELLTRAGFRSVKVRHFLFGLNTIAIGEKP
jgi:SAM-dependent methyltransferase